MQRLDVQLLGGFRVEVDSRDVTDEAWAHGRAKQLVKLLALSPNHRLSRDQVIEALWPHLEPDAGAANLHKAASYARRALGDRGAVVLRKGQVELAPDAEVSTDIDRFEAGDESAYGGELLPEDRYEEWTIPARERLSARQSEISRERGRWEEVLASDPTDEEASRALMRARADSGDRAAAVREFSRLREELARLGLTPERETVELVTGLSRGSPVRADSGDGTALTGREDELRLIAKALDQAEALRGGVLMIEGDPGIGKTRLAEAAIARGSDRGWHTLRGAARGGEVPVPYGPILEALGPLLRDRPDLLAQLSGETAQVLSVVAASRRPLSEPGSSSISQEELFASVAELLAAAAGESGLVVVLDDMHEADDATVRLIGYLARSARELRLLIVLCLRTVDDETALAGLRRQLAERRIAVSLKPGPLDSSSVRAIAEEVTGRQLPATALAAIERSAAGNPFFVEELAATMDADGEVSVPEHVHELLRSRLEPLDPDAAELLPYLAVLAEPFELAEVAALAGCDQEHAATALRSATRAGVLRPAGAEGFSFRHPLLGEAARRQIPPQQLAAAHVHAAERLRATGAPPERIAHHLLSAGQAGEAVPLLAEAAGWALEIGAYGEGLRWVETALEHAGPAERPSLLELLAELRDRTGDPHAPLAYGDAVAAAAPERRLPLRIKQARAYVAAGDVEAASLIAAELDTEGAEPADIARATLTRGLVAWHQGDMDEARACASKAGELCQAEGIGEEALEQEDLAAMVAHADGSWGAHVQWRMGETWQLPEVAGRVYDAYLCVTEYVMQAGEPYDRLREFARTLRIHARRAGAKRGEAYATTILGEAELLSGDAELAREHLAEAARLSRQVRATGSESIARARLGEAMLTLGDREGAAAQLEEALGLAYHSSLAPHLLPIAHGLAIRVPADPHSAVDLVDRAESILDQRSLCGACNISLQLPAAIACARAGELARAQGFVARAEDIVGQWRGWTPWNAAIAEAQGEIMLAEGRPADGTAAFRRALEGFAAAGQGLSEARVREALTALS